MKKLILAFAKKIATLDEICSELSIGRLSSIKPVIRRREELGILLNILNLRGSGVEIGVCKASFSFEVLSRWGGERYFAVDPWREFPKDAYIDLANRPQAEQEQTFEVAKRRLKEFGNRVEIIRSTSAEAAPGFADETLDFAYIDGQHHYEAVAEDIALWYPKVKPGGLLCGHDYLDGFVDNAAFGVKKAVDEFVFRQGLDLLVSLERDFPSWFVFKPDRRTSNHDCA